MSLNERKTFERRAPRNMEAGPFQDLIDSWELHLRAEKKSDKTIQLYTEAARWFAATHLLPQPDEDSMLGRGRELWEDVTGDDVRTWIVALLADFSDSYANNQYRSLQQFFRWFADEDPDVPRRNPMLGMKPPKVDEKLVPVFTEEELDALIGTCKGAGFQARRDKAILELFKDTGMRLAELTGLTLADVDVKTREATVTGKGGKQRTVRFRAETARSLDRYIRARRETSHSYKDKPALWLGIRNRPPMTSSGIYQMVERRGQEAGVEVHPHKFRHHFSHTWLDKGGAEGDLKELNGWSSDQMLRRYGASARGARARRSYDRIMDQ